MAKNLNLNNIISIKGISKKYSSSKEFVLHDFSLDIKRNEFFCFVGLSGCGKSTVLKIIAGLEGFTSGEIEKPDNIAMVFQSGALFPWLTVEENIAFGLHMKNIHKGDLSATVHHFMTMVKLSDFKKKYPRELSGGQRQRVGIARALAIQPEILLLDEPFSALDPLTAQELHNDLIAIWQETHITVVMVSHMLEEAIFLADRIGIIEKGCIKNIVEIKIPRPRNMEAKNTVQLLDEIKKCLFTVGELTRK